MNRNGKMDLRHVYKKGAAGVYFDIDNDGFAERVGWVESGDGQLARDTNGNGYIDDITELFGDDMMPAYSKLRKLDANKDHKIDKQDPEYNNLLIWQDKNQNGISEADELQTLQQAKIEYLSLAEIEFNEYVEENFISSYSEVKFIDGQTVKMADVHFLNDNLNTWYKGAKSEVYGSEVEIDLEAIILPLSRGYGSLPSLHIAVSENPKLKELLQDLTDLKLKDFGYFAARLEYFLYEWAGVSHINPHSLDEGSYRNNIDARKVNFIEQFTGTKWAQLGVMENIIGVGAAAGAKRAWNEITSLLMGRVLVQGTLKAIFPKAIYDFKQDRMLLNSDMNEIMHNSKEYINEFNDKEILREFFIYLGNICAQHKEELKWDISRINQELSSLYGENLHIAKLGITKEHGTEIFTIKDQDIDQVDSFTFTNDASNPHQVHGSKFGDMIFGSDIEAEIDGGDGDDIIFAGKKSTIIKGGAGNDFLRGNDGSDEIIGGEGDDFLYGGDGDDKLYGGEGNDEMQGGAGADYIDGGAGTNTLSYYTSKEAVYVNLQTYEFKGGDAEGDKIFNITNISGSTFDDVLIGDDQANILNGEGGSDKLYGGKGDDKLFNTGSEGTVSYLYGEDGDDMLAGHERVEHMDGGDGIDTVYYNDPRNGDIGVKVDLVSGKGSGGAAQGDSYINIENIIGTESHDVLIGDGRDNILHGLAGYDVLIGGDGDDTLIGGEGFNYLIGGQGNDTFTITPHTFVDYILDFNITTDKIEFSLDFDAINMQIYKHKNHTLLEINKNNIIYLTDINPTDLKVSNFKDKASEVLLNYKELTDQDQSIRTSPDKDGINHILGNFLDNKIIGSEHNDRIYALNGNNEIYANTGDDIIFPGLGIDIIDGGEGIDRVNYFNSFASVIIDTINMKGKGGTAEGDEYKNIEIFIGSSFNDIFIMNNIHHMNYSTTYQGGTGDDLFILKDKPLSLIIIDDFEYANPNEKIDLSNIDFDILYINSSPSQATLLLNKNNENFAQDLEDNKTILLNNINYTKLKDSSFIVKEGTKIKRAICPNIPDNYNSNTIVEIIGSNYSEFIMPAENGFNGYYIFNDGKGSDIMYGSLQSKQNLFKITKNINDFDQIYNFRNEKKILYYFATKDNVATIDFKEENVANKKLILIDMIDLQDFSDITNFQDLNITNHASGSLLHLAANQTLYINGEPSNSILSNELYDRGVEITFHNGQITKFPSGLLCTVQSTYLGPENFIFYDSDLAI